MKKCPKCEMSQIVKAGIVRTKQRYCCKTCNYYFTVSERSNSSNKDDVKRAYEMYKKGIQISQIAKVTNLSQSNIYKWMLSPYCHETLNQWNPFAKIGCAKELLSELETYVNFISGGQLIVRHFSHRSSIYFRQHKTTEPFKWKKMFTLNHPMHRNGATQFMLEFYAVKDYQEFEQMYGAVFLGRIKSNTIPFKVKDVSDLELIEEVFGGGRAEEMDSIIDDLAIQIKNIQSNI